MKEGSKRRAKDSPSRLANMSSALRGQNDERKRLFLAILTGDCEFRIEILCKLWFEA